MNQDKNKEQNKQNSSQEDRSKFWHKPIKSKSEKKKRSRFKRFRNRPKKDINLLHLLPNVLTSLNISCGLASIVYSVEGRYEIAAVLIILAAFFDLIDGKVARFVGVSSPFGVQLDSLADAVSFGVAPPILIRAISYQGYHRLGLSLVLVYSLCAILRLARYNVQALQNSGDKRDSFQGLPSPVPAVFLASLVWFCQDFAIPLSDPIIRSVVHILVVCLAFLMVSTIRYPDFAGLKVEKKYIYQHHVTLVLIMCVIVLIGKFFFLAASSLYILSGLVLSLNEMRKTKKVEESEPQSPPDQEQSRAER